MAMTPNAAAADLAVVFSADTSELKRALGATAKAVQRTETYINKSTGRASKSLGGMGAVGRKVGTIFKGRMGAQVQQAGFQITDFATQVTAGTGAMQAFSMQAPQLLGAFGPIGSLLGVVAGVAGTLGTQLLFAGDAAGETKSKFEDLVEPLGSIGDGLDDLKDLQEAYTAAVAQHAEIQTAASARNVAAIGRELQARVDLLKFEAQAAQQEQIARREALRARQAELEERREAEARLAEIADNQGRRYAEERAALRGKLADLRTERDLKKEIAQLNLEIARSANVIGRYIDAKGAGGAIDEANKANTSAKPPGMATGGTFRVGGTGGTDSRMVGFRASPGELIRVQQPAQAGGALGDLFGYAERKLKEALRERAEAEVEVTKRSEFLEDALGDAGRAAVRAGFQIEDMAKAFLRSFGSDLAGRFTSAGGAMLSKGLSTIASDFLGGATGGTFKVGGTGGTDGKLVSLKASPGEIVSVQQPGHAGGGGVTNVTYQIDARGADQGVVARIESALAEHVANHDQHVAKGVKRAQSERVLGRRSR